MAESTFRFEEHFTDAFALFKRQFGVLVVAGLIALVLSAVTFGILAGPLAAGLLLMVRRMLENDPQPPTAGDVFKGFEVFAPAFLVTLFFGLAVWLAMLLLVVPLIGQVVFLAVCLLAGPASVWALALVAYRRMGAVAAFGVVLQRVKAGNFWMPLVFALLAAIISGAGSAVCGVGIVVTMPFAACLIACGYRDAFGPAAG